MRRNSEKGFSLIELSIVLIIIGLLIAGITGGASLVKSATVRAVIAEANSFNSAVNAYYARTSNLPGDDSRGNVTNPGDGNGRIEYVNGSAELTEAVRMEGLNAWDHLVDLDVVEGNFTTAADNAVDGDGAVPGDNMPNSKLSAAGWALDYKNTEGMNMLVLSNPTALTIVASTVAELESTNVISPENAESIDSKMDDGQGDTGKIRGYNDTALTDCYDADGAYADETTPACYMGFATAL